MWMRTSPRSRGSARAASPGDRVSGDPIEASLRISDGLLRVQAIALHAGGDLDPWKLLWWNRQTRLVRFGCTRSKDLWVHADIPVSDADERGVDRLLGLITEAVVAVRGHAAGVRAAAEAPTGGWLPDADA